MINISIKEEFVALPLANKQILMAELAFYIACSPGINSLAKLMEDAKRFEYTYTPSISDKSFINIFKDGVHIIQISDDFHPIELDYPES